MARELPKTGYESLKSLKKLGPTLRKSYPHKLAATMLVGVKRLGCPIGLKIATGLLTFRSEAIGFCPFNLVFQVCLVVNTKFFFANPAGNWE